MQTIKRKSLLYKSGVEYADFSLNHVEGCSHGCKYPCYAFMMKRRCGTVKTYDEWCRPKIVSNALDLLDKEIPKYRNKIKFVHLCFSTDPFMYGQEQVCDLSLRIIDKLNGDNIRCTLLTKGILPSELGDRNGFSTANEYGITLVSLKEAFRREFEPNSAKFKDRIDSLRYLHNKGFKTWVSMEPYPTPNLIEQDLMEILEAVSFVDKIVFGKLNYSAKTSEIKYLRDFYNGLALSVISFCQRNKIDFHIKHGTQM